MGLDMYVWSVDAKKVRILEDIDAEFVEDAEPEELFYWRKHHDLHGWMENLYRERGGENDFNCVKVRLYPEDLDQLEIDLISNKLPQTSGFFFGNNPPDKETLESDMNFILKAREAIRDNKLVFYDSWW
jgi:hypothetical protein